MAVFALSVFSWLLVIALCLGLLALAVMFLHFLFTLLVDAVDCFRERDRR